MTFKKLFLLSLLCLRTIPADTDKLTMAVVSFANNTGQVHLNHLRSAVAEKLKTALSELEELVVLERENLEPILKEQALSQTGIVNPEQAITVGQLSNAQYIVYGDLSGTHKKMTITAQVADANTGQLAGEKVTGNAQKHLNRMIDILAYNIRHNLTGTGGSVEKYKVRNGWFASLAIVTGVSWLTSGIFYSIYNDTYKNQYEKAGTLEDIETYYNRANASYKTSGVFAGIGAGLTAVTGYLWMKSLAPSNYIYTQTCPVPQTRLCVSAGPDRVRYSLEWRF